MMSLRSRIMRTFTANVLLILLLIFVVISVIVSGSFQSYKQNLQARRNEEIVTSIVEAYQQDLALSQETKATLAFNARRDRYKLTIYDIEQNAIFETIGTMSGLGQMKGRNQANHTGNYQEETYPLIANHQAIGTVVIGQYGALLWYQEDQTLIRNLIIGLLITSVIALAVSLTAGRRFSRRLAEPIVQMKTITDTLHAGDLSVRSTVKADTLEIQSLSDSINHLAGSLEEQELLRKRLTSDVSHELRTPLNVLQNHIEALIDGIWEPSPARLNICRDEVLQLTMLVQKLEKLTTLDTYDAELNITHFELAEWLTKVCETFALSFKEKGITFTFPQRQPLWVEADRHQLTQVLSNLLANALKFTPANGQVWVELSSDHGNAVLSCKDNGPGIATPDLPRIFERFFRGEISRNRQTGGSGLGLSIAKSIVTAHGGQIEAKSQLGEGTEFIVILPIVAQRVTRN